MAMREASDTYLSHTNSKQQPPTARMHFKSISRLPAMASETRKMGAQDVTLSKDRLTQAGEIGEAAIRALYPKVLADANLKYPEPDKVLRTGIMFKEGHVTSNIESRLFRLRLAKDWTPMLTYHRPDSGDEDVEFLGEHHLASFTFVPTKIARKESNMSWRLDATGASIGKGKNDKLVVMFKNPDECHRWQAAFAMCRIAKSYAEELKMKEKQAEQQRADEEAAAIEMEQQRLEQERQALIEKAISESMQQLTKEEEESRYRLSDAGRAAAEAEAAAARAAEEAEAARLSMEKEQREEEEARARMEKEAAEAEEARRVLDKEAAEAEEARLAMNKEEEEAEEARLAMLKEVREAEEAKAKFDKEHAEFIAAAADHAKEFEEAEAAFKVMEAAGAAVVAAKSRGAAAAEIDELERAHADAKAAYKKEADEAKEALERLRKEEQEADQAFDSLEKEQAEANAAVAVHSKEEAEAEAARAAYEKEEAERVEAQKVYEKELAEADAARADHEREAAEADAARLVHAQKQREADEAKALQEQRDQELAAAAAADAALRARREAEERAAAEAAAAPVDQVKPKPPPPSSPKAPVDPEQAAAAQAFVNAGGEVLKYMRAKLIEGKWHDPHAKNVKVEGTSVKWDKRSFVISDVKLGPSMLLSTNNPGEDLSGNFHCFLSGVASGEDQLDLQAPSKELAEKWVLGIKACIGKL